MGVVMVLLSRNVRKRARKLGASYSFLFMQANGAQLRELAALYRGAQISTPWNEATVDPTGWRYRRTSHQDDRFLERVQQTLA